MQLNNLKPAWQQLKLSNRLQHIEPNDILSIIERPESINKSKIQSVFLNIVVFIVLTICCQSG